MNRRKDDNNAKIDTCIAGAFQTQATWVTSLSVSPRAIENFNVSAKLAKKLRTVQHKKRKRELNG